MNFFDYINSIGLPHLSKDIQHLQLNTYVETWRTQSPSQVSNADIDQLYQYRVPKLGSGGSCSITSLLEEKPYDLATTFGLHQQSLQRNPMTIRLWRLNRIVDELHRTTGVDWLGMYRTIEKSNGERVLVKESYRGAPSRAEFPLTEDFARNSNNSTVGLTGKAVLFQDIETYQGPYYKCDSKVQSEFCVPILNSAGAVIGIIDAESFHKQFFTSERILHIAKVCADLGTLDTLFST